MLKVLQIIPAHNVVAVFKAEPGEDESPVICWALCEDEDGYRSVEGMTTVNGEPCLELVKGEFKSYFLRYKKTEA